LSHLINQKHNLNQLNQKIMKWSNYISASIKDLVTSAMMKWTICSMKLLAKRKNKVLNCLKTKKTQKINRKNLRLRKRLLLLKMK